MSEDQPPPPPPEKPKFKEGTRFGKWYTVKKLDEGSFGAIYLVRNKDSTKQAAMKAESNFVDGGSAIKQELQVLLKIHEGGTQPHVPIVFESAKRTKFCYMILTLLGKNFKMLEKEHGDKDEILSESTWVRLGIQCFYALKIMHDVGYLHRDIKPSNFAMGHSSDGERARLVHILDFGMTRSFAFHLKEHGWIGRIARSSAEFRGTPRYCSPNVHFNIEQGRRDDIWSVIYVLIELGCKLPWQYDDDPASIERAKCLIPDKELMMGMPRELRQIPANLRKIDFYARPDYGKIHAAFLATMKRKNISFSDPYDWEPKGKKIVEKPQAYHNAKAFFESDPLKINGFDKNWSKFKAEADITMEKQVTKDEEGEEDKK